MVRNGRINARASLKYPRENPTQWPPGLLAFNAVCLAASYDRLGSEHKLFSQKGTDFIDSDRNSRFDQRLDVSLHSRRAFDRGRSFPFDPSGLCADPSLPRDVPRRYGKEIQQRSV